MTRKELVSLMGMATANFPRLQGKDMTQTLTLWENTLSDMSFEQAKQALLKVLSTSKFFPTVADIRQASVDLHTPNKKPFFEAWDELTKAIRKFGSYREQQALEWLSDDVEQMVRRFGYQDLCLTQEIGVIRGQFRKAWEEQSKTQNNFAVLPEQIRELANEKQMIE